MTVEVAGNKLPDVSPYEMKSLVWTPLKSGGAVRAVNWLCISKQVL